MNRKVYAGAALALVGLAVVFALLSFVRQNWGADQAPGAVESLVARWLLNGSREAQENIANPVAPTAEHLDEGRKLYQGNCAFCHGADGAGPGAAGAQFYPPAPSLMESSGRLSDSQIRSIITRGIRYTGMPSFARALTDEQIWTITLWLRRLPAPPQSQ